MQRLVFRPSTGIASSLEALSILRHFEREYGREAFSLVQVFRDSQTKRHLGYIMADTKADVSERLLEEGDHYVQTMNPTGYNESSGPFVASRYKTTLQDVINSLRLEGTPSADKPTSTEVQKIMQIKVEPATDGTFGNAKPIQRPIGNLPGQLQYRAPDPHQLRDLLRMFDGFAKPGRLGVPPRQDFPRQGMEEL